MSKYDLSDLPDQDDEESPITAGFDLSDLPDQDDNYDLFTRYQQSREAPDDYSQTLRLSEASGLPVETARKHKADLQKELNQPDWAKMSRNLKSVYRDVPDMVELAHDDVDNLTWYEEYLFKPAYRAGKHFDAGRAQVEASNVISQKSLMNAIINGEYNEDELAAASALLGEQVDAPDNIIETVLFPTAQQLPIMAETIKGKAAGYAAGGAVGLVTQAITKVPVAKTFAKVGGNVGSGYVAYNLESSLAFAEFADIRDENGDRIDARAAAVGAVAVGGINGALELAGLETILKSVPGSDLVKGWIGRQGVKEVLKNRLVRNAIGDFAKRLAIASAGEGITEGLQESVNILVGEAIKVISEGDFENLSYQIKDDKGGIHNLTGASAFWARVFDAAGQGAIAGGGLSTPLNAVSLRLDVAAINKAQSAMETMDALGDAAKASKLRERNPNKFQQAMRYMVDSNPETDKKEVWINADDFKRFFGQQNMDVSDVIRDIGVKGLQEQYDQAIVSGGDIVIPIDAYAAKIAGTQYHEGLSAHARFNVTDISYAEAEKQKTIAEESAKAEIASIAESYEAMTDQQRGYQHVLETIKNDLVSMPQWEKNHGEAHRLASTVAQSMMTKAFMFNQHDGGKRTAKDIFDLNPIRVTGGNPSTGQNIFTHVLPEALPKNMIEGDGKKAAELYRGDLPDVSIYLGQSSKRLARDFPKLATYSHSFDKSAAMHIFNRHGDSRKEAKRGQVAITDKDIEMIPDIIQNYDATRTDLKSKRGNPVIAYVKKYDDGVVLYFEEVRKKRKDMAALSMRKYPAANDALQILQNSVLDVRNDNGHGSILASTDSEVNFFNHKDDSVAPRASIDLTGFDEGMEAIIQISRKGDLSSFLHETGHYYLQQMIRMASMEDAPPAIKRDLQVTMDWLGVSDPSEITREHHEKWAEHIEIYWQEGKAPSESLRDAFDRFSVWINHLYTRILKPYQNEMTDEIRSVFDRIYATELEIEAAKQRNDVDTQLINDPKLTDQEREKLREITAKRDRIARETLRAEVMQDLLKKQQDWYASKLDEKKQAFLNDLYKEQKYRTLHILRRGFEFGVDAADQRNIKLSKQDILDRWGEDTLDALRKHKPFIYSKDGGLPVDVAASELGYLSPDKLIEDMQSVETVREIENLALAKAEEDMAKEYGDLLTDGSMEREADAAISNSSEAELLEYQIRIMARSLPDGSAYKDIPRSILKTYAKEHIRKLTPGEAVTERYRVAQIRAAKSAAVAREAGKHEEAVAHKVRELTNHYLYREAVDSAKAYEKQHQFLRNFSKKSYRERLGKAGPGFLKAVDTFLGRFELRKSISVAAQQNEKQEAMAILDWAQGLQNEGIAVEIPDSFIANTEKVHYKNLTYGEFEELYSHVKHIYQIAQTANRIEMDGRKLEMEEVVAQAEREAGSLKDRAKRSVETELSWNRKANKVSEFLADHRKIGSLVRQLDSHKDGGFFWKLIMRPIREATNTELKMRRKAAERLKEIFSVYDNENLTKKIDTQTEVFGKLSKMGLLMLAMNWGNQHGRQRIVDGYGISEKAMNAIFSKHMSKEDWQFVQNVIDHINSYWPEIVELEEQTKGYAPEKVEAQEIFTRHGVFKGGYFPLVYNRDLNPKSFEIATEDSAKAMYYGKPETSQGFTKKRMEHHDEMIALDFSVIYQHIDDVTHDLTHRKAVRQINRLLHNKQLRSLIDKKLGFYANQEFDLWLKRVAAGDVVSRTSLDPFFRNIRTGAAVSTMAWKFSTAAIQFLGYTQSIHRIGAKWMAVGLMETLSSINSDQSAIKFAMKNSEMLRERPKSFDRDARDVIRSHEVKKGSKLGKARHAVSGSFFSMIGNMQLLVDVPTWIGAYEKALSEGRSQSEAFLIADQVVVDTQTSGLIGDLAQIQTGTDQHKLLTVFYSFFSATYNLIAESYDQRWRQKSWGERLSPANLALITRDYLLLSLIPSLLGDLLMGYGPEDDESWLEWGVKHNLAYNMSTMVLVREFSGALTGFDYSGPAGMRLMGAMYDFYKQAAQGEFDRAFWRAGINLAGIGLHFPASQINVTVDGIIKHANGELDSPAGLFFRGYQDKD